MPVTMAGSDAEPVTASATSGAPTIDRAKRNGPRNSSSAPTATVRTPRAAAISLAARRRRVLPMPGSPSTETAANRPASAAAIPSSIAVNSVGRPTIARPVRCSSSPRGAKAAPAIGPAAFTRGPPRCARPSDYLRSEAPSPSLCARTKPGRPRSRATNRASALGGSRAQPPLVLREGRTACFGCDTASVGLVSPDPGTGEVAGGDPAPRACGGGGGGAQGQLYGATPP